MQKVLSIAEKSAPTDAAILITGESGTGKEVLAKYIHNCSVRKDGMFTAVNIGGVNESLMESELFGYEKGAFTGADKRKIGLFELAAKGTLSELEKNAITAALQRNEGHRQKTADELGVTRRTLLNKIKEYNINPSNL